jgi:hypothetical protein
MDARYGLLFAIVWVIACVWVYRDAKARGVDGITWAVVVFFFNIFGLLFWLIYRKPKELAPPQSAPESTRSSTPWTMPSNWSSSLVAERDYLRDQVAQQQRLISEYEAMERDYLLLKERVENHFDLQDWSSHVDEELIKTLNEYVSELEQILASYQRVYPPPPTFPAPVPLHRTGRAPAPRQTIRTVDEPEPVVRGRIGTPPASGTLASFLTGSRWDVARDPRGRDPGNYSGGDVGDWRNNK